MNSYECLREALLQAANKKDVDVGLVFDDAKTSYATAEGPIPTAATSATSAKAPPRDTTSPYGLPITPIPPFRYHPTKPFNLLSASEKRSVLQEVKGPIYKILDSEPTMADKTALLLALAKKLEREAAATKKNIKSSR